MSEWDDYADTIAAARDQNTLAPAHRAWFEPPDADPLGPMWREHTARHTPQPRNWQNARDAAWATAGWATAFAAAMLGVLFGVLAWDILGPLLGGHG